MNGSAVLLFAVHALSVGAVFVYALGQYHLLWRYWRTRGRPAPSDPPALGDRDWPSVTVQLPLYNERYVAEQVIEACARLEYPRDRLELQVLDDSTDDTTAIVEAAAATWRAHGITVTVRHRTDRSGYKAGALADATPDARGELIAIFDADFRPAPDFLRRLVPEFDMPDVAAVQARWGHLNRDYSLLTRAQSLLHDAFFYVEQEARHRSGYFTRFNGSAGIWRASAIVDAGGWSADTLSEDMDLAYRAQLRGWRLVYRRDVVAPAELPVTVADYHTQQHRWHKGRSQVVRKLLGPTWRTPLPFGQKLHALFDQLNAIIVPGVLLLALTAPWFTAAAQRNPWMQGPAQWFILSQINVLLLPIFGWIALQVYATDPWPRLWQLLRTMPALLLLFLGMNLALSIGLIEGCFDRSAEFRRTAKYRVDDQTGAQAWRGTRYAPRRDLAITWGSSALALLFVWYLRIDVSLQAWSLMLFHATLAAACSVVAVRAWRRA